MGNKSKIGAELTSIKKTLKAIRAELDDAADTWTAAVNGLHILAQVTGKEDAFREALRTKVEEANAKVQQ